MGGRATNNEHRFQRQTVEKVNNEISALLGEFCSQYILCGSYRRNLNTIGDMDYVLVVDHGKNNISDKAHELKDKITSNSKRSIIEYPTEEGNIQIDFYSASNEDFGAQVLTWTGSKDFNIRCRGMAKRLGFKLNQYGLFQNEQLISTNEAEILNKLGFGKFIIPSARV